MKSWEGYSANFDEVPTPIIDATQVNPASDGIHSNNDHLDIFVYDEETKESNTLLVFSAQVESNVVGLVTDTNTIPKEYDLLHTIKKSGENEDATFTQ